MWRDYTLGHIVSCKMHDVVHDLALSTSQGEILIWEAGSSIDENSGIRHLRVKFDGQGLPNIPRGVVQRLRSLICDVRVFSSVAFDWKNLRSLKLLGRGCTELPASLGKLKHLKYLDITESDIQVLPKSFSKLYNLQTLRLWKEQPNRPVAFDENPEKFPDSLTKLISLRHICYKFVTYRRTPNNQDLPRPPIKCLPRGIGRLTSLKMLRVKFFVGKEEGYKIEELGRLSQLEGVLQIGNLEQVRSELEASEVKLEEKTKLYALGFSWDAPCREGDYNNHEKVLRALQPHLNLKSLKINEYLGEEFPSWIAGNHHGFGSSSFLLNNLVELTLGDCRNCIVFPDLGLLPNLQRLYIFGMSEVRRMDYYMVESIEPYLALKELHIRDMEKLEEGVSTRVGMATLPCLEHLYIIGCPRLETWYPSISTQLSTVCIRSCPRLEAIPLMNRLTSLKYLMLMNCDELTSLPDVPESYISLTALSIKSCINLSIPEGFLGHLTLLKDLEIGGFRSELEEFPGLNGILHLPLEHLELQGWEKLKSLPHQLQDLTALKSLTITDFDRLEALPEWMANLSSLQNLSIWGCENLTSLPPVEAMQRLSNLKFLSIEECPKLTERCAKENGPEWSKISHIPNIEINGRDVA
ncbi:hypothetical protein SLA2020_383360 [Shorea laevis]